MKRILHIICGCVAAGALLAGCRKDPREARIAAGEAVVNVGASPRSLDQSLATDISSTQMLVAFQRGATILDADGKPQPDLAESWTESPDHKVFDFKLRPQKWSNGDPLTANDFVYAWTQRMLNPKFGAEYVDLLYFIKGAKAFYLNPALGAASVGVSAPAPDHLHVELENPAPFFLQLMAHQAFYPVCEQADKANPHWAERAETYVGNGPFLLKTYKSGDAVIGEKNPNYWNAASVKLNKLTFRMIDKESTARIELDTGELDAMDTAPRDELDSLRGTPELRFSNMLGTYFVYFNCKKKPLDDPRVRRALGLAVDRAAITQSVSRAGEPPAFLYAPPKLYGTTPTLTFKDADYAAARKLLADAGYPGGKGFPHLNYIYNQLELHQHVAEVLQETWKRELGIDIDVQVQEFKVVLNNRRSGNFDLARGSWSADYPDASSFLDTLDSDSDINDAHWSDPKFDALTHQARLEPDAARRLQILGQADAYMTTQMPIIPIYYYTSPYLCTPRLQGYVIGLLGLYDPARLAWSAP